MLTVLTTIIYQATESREVIKESLLFWQLLVVANIYFSKRYLVFHPPIPLGQRGRF